MCLILLQGRIVFLRVSMAMLTRELMIVGSLEVTNWMCAMQIAEVRLSDGLPMLPDAGMTQMLDCNNGSPLVKQASKRLQFCCIGVYICR